MFEMNFLKKRTQLMVNQSLEIVKSDFFTTPPIIEHEIQIDQNENIRDPEQSNQNNNKNDQKNIVVLEILPDGTCSKISSKERGEKQTDDNLHKEQESENTKLQEQELIEIDRVQEKIQTPILKEINAKETLILNENAEVQSHEVQIQKKILNEEETEQTVITTNIEKSEAKKRKSKCKKETVQKRLKGKCYIGYKRKNKIITHNVEKPAKSIKARCSHEIEPKKIKKQSLRCSLITEEERVSIFNKFWSLPTWDQKKTFVQNFARTRPLRRRCKNILDTEEAPKKKAGHDYFLINKNGEHLKVCRVMFLHTLDLGEDSMKRWTVGETTNPVVDLLDDENLSECSPKQTQKKITCRKTKQVQKEQNVKEWLQLIPKVPSHYCRASTSRVYVDNSFITKNHMYRLYKKWCNERSAPAAHIKLFRSVLESEKVSVHKPRKDQCDTCIAYKTKTIGNAEYEQHTLKQKAERKAKELLKNSVDNEKLVVTVDLQSVLTCPKSLASQSYYKLKLQVHNFTIYSLNNEDVQLYVWHEANGGVSSNEFTSCLIDYLNNTPDNYKTVIFISEGCNYQNRKKTLASAISDISRANNITIQQLYLEKGHTMMEADSVHSTLEHYFHPPINSPIDYVTRMRLARPKHPYNIKSIDFTFFKKYDITSNFNSIRPGKKAGDPQVVDIRQLKYSPNGEVHYTTDFSDNWMLLSHRRENQEMTVYECPLFKKPPPISDDKYKYLQDLKSVIQREHHHFYDTL